MTNSKEVYVAGKIDASETSIEDFAHELEIRGHIVLEKWWKMGRLPKPYMDYPETSSPAAAAMVDAAYNSDVFILFPDAKILGAAVELGAAIASTKVNLDKQIVIVDPFETRQSVFYVHPVVVAVRGLEQVRQMGWY